MVISALIHVISTLMQSQLTCNKKLFKRTCRLNPKLPCISVCFKKENSTSSSFSHQNVSLLNVLF